MTQSLDDPRKETPAVNRREFIERSAAFGVALGVGSRGLGAFGDTVAGLRATTATSRGSELTLANDAMECVWTVTDGRLRCARLRDRMHGADLPVPDHVFSLRLADGSTIVPDAMTIAGAPVAAALEPAPGASRAADRAGGRQLTIALRDSAGTLSATWRAILRNGSHYLRQELTLASTGADVPLRDVTLVDLHAPQPMVTGLVRGSPVVSGNAFFALEHPLSTSRVDGDRVQCSMRRSIPLRQGAALTLSSVVGITRPGQRRRDFLAYVERERAHPYRTFLHYNSWYDIGYFGRYSEADALDAITGFGAELHEKRNVTLDSFLFDDGWDDPKTLWHFNAGFPDGFTKVRAAAERYGADPGVWMSPWGGYGQPREERLQYGRAQGFETNQDGFALSGPVYYKRFRDTCLDMVRRYGVNQFKFDGTGDAANTIPGSAFDSDFDAAIHLIGELREEKPDLFVNLTTGTYPSPFWLRYADSIWRGGDDHDFAGVGSDRQRWITYRDQDTYEHVVRAGMLFPLNSLMLHGLIYAKQAHNLNTDPQHDFRSEVHSYFGSGTQLQEMYITHALLSPGDWDTLAEAARWSRRNAATLVDTHWVGGDPVRLEPYGWAAWSSAGGILTLRNPGNAAAVLPLDVATAFELPDHAPRRYIARSPWHADSARPPLTLRAGHEHVFRLMPFEVLTLEMLPR